MLKLKRSILYLFKLNTQNSYWRSQAKASKDLYQILGVHKDADAKQLKKAYYKLAHQYHPDKNSTSEGKQKFTDIKNAYEILSNKEKRQMYDQTGSEGDGNTNGYESHQSKGRQQGQSTNHNSEDIFSQFKGFKNQQESHVGGFQDILKDFFGGGRSHTQRQTSYQSQMPSTMNISLTFQESVKGGIKILQYQIKSACSNCKGSRCKPGTQPETCKSCQGSGMQNIRQGGFIMQTTCMGCGGEGQKINTPCPICSGSGQQKKKVKEQFNIPRGISDGMTIKLSQKGNFQGDLFIKVKVQKSQVFARQGNNAFSQIQIPVLEAIMGAEREVMTIEGTKKKIKIPQGMQPLQKIVLPNEGFYMINSNSRGDHIITITITVPRTLTDQQRSLYQKLREIGK